MKDGIPAFVKPIRYFTGNPDYCDRCVTWEITGRTPWCWEDAIIFIRIISGSGILRVNGLTTELTPGMLCQMQSFHIFQLEPAGSASLITQVIVLPYQLVCHMICWPCVDATARIVYGSPGWVSFDEGDREEAAKLFSLYEQESNCKNPNGLIQYGILSQLYALTFSALPKDKKMVKTMPRAFQILLYLYTYCDQDLRLNEVAAHFEISASRLNTELRRISGASFKQVLGRARFMGVISGLFQADVSMQTLARRSGFPDEGSVYREFTRQVNTTPAEYRDQMLTLGGRTWHTTSDLTIAVVQYLLENCREPIRVNTCAQALYLSPERVNQLLRQAYPDRSWSFQKALNNIRLSFARAFLAVSDLPVCDIAINSGFNSVHTFIRLFKQAFRMTPTEYRCAQKEETP